MPGLICGRRNDGKFRLSDGSGLYCRHAGPIDVLGRGRYRGEALICSSCFLLTACPIIGRVTRRKPIIWRSVLTAIMWKEVEKMHDYEIFIRKNEWEHIGAGSASLKTVYPALQRIAKHLNYHGLMMLQQTYVDKKIYFVV